MTNIKSKRRRLYSVVQINQSGTHESTWAEKTAFGTSMMAPIIWNKKPAELHFWNYNKRVDVNQDATDLFAREGFAIRGPVLIRTGDAMFFGLKAQGEKHEVERELENLGLSAPPVILRAREWLPHQNIYTQDENDAFAIRMRLR